MANITISCKLPHGLHLQLGEKRITLNGTMKSNRLGRFFTAPDNCVGLTQVPEDFWEEWVKQNETLDMLKNGYIYASTKKKEAFAEAEDKKSLKTGQERIDPDKLPKNVQQIKAGETA